MSVALQLHIAGPALEFSRHLAPGEPAVVLGRDADCAICLPDPERNVSRRHLSIWNDGGQLQFHVLSLVNGVALGGQELPPGARGVLQDGETLVLAAYRLTVQPVADAGELDPWALLEQQAAAVTAQPPAGAEEDPFGDWGFESTFGARGPGGRLDADSLQPATDLQPFLRGLGLEAGEASALTRGELEVIGRATRAALLGLLQGLEEAGGARAALRADDRTRVFSADKNPLYLDAPLETKLRYLVGGRAAAGALLPPDRAVAQVATELLAHQEALRLAARAAVEGALQEFEPQALRERLLGQGARLFGSARAWDAFVKDDAGRRQDLEGWVQQILERHFAAAYLREFIRLKRDTGTRRG